jgi:hypothetical protein
VRRSGSYVLSGGENRRTLTEVVFLLVDLDFQGLVVDAAATVIVVFGAKIFS